MGASARRFVRNWPAAVGASGLGWLLLAAAPSPAIEAAAAQPSFLQPNRCYRLTFSIAGAPNWKVLEVLDAGWIRAEVDAGPVSAHREPVWVNTAQIVTARDATCSR